MQANPSESQSNRPNAVIVFHNTEVTHHPLLLEQNLANRIGLAVFLKSKNVIDKTKKWKVLASIVLTNELDGSRFLRVICVTSGSKCVKGKALGLIGSSVNDCHAEVLARRCFITFLYQQLNSLINCGFKGKFPLHPSIEIVMTDLRSMTFYR